MSPIDYKKYGTDWKELSADVIEKAGGKCELCPAVQGKPHWKTGSKVVLSVHHIDGNRKNNSNGNLIALCQRCHLRLDLPLKWTKRKNRKAELLESPGEIDGDTADAIQTLISGDNP